MPGSSAEITHLLRAWGDGETSALDRLTPLVYDELRRVARRKMRSESDGHTLQATALVNEVFLRLMHVSQVQWQDRTHFFAFSASIMRRILLDAARTRASAKRGGRDLRITFSEDLPISSRHHELITLDDALQALSNMDPRKGQVVELRYFGGLSVNETAEVLKLSPQSVMRDWKLAKAWLAREMSAKGPNES